MFSWTLSKFFLTEKDSPGERRVEEGDDLRRGHVMSSSPGREQGSWSGDHVQKGFQM